MTKIDKGEMIMSIKFKVKQLKRLWEITGEIGCMIEDSDDRKLEKLYEMLSDVLDYATDVDLIMYKGNQENEAKNYRGKLWIVD